MFAADFGTGEVFLSMLWFFLFLLCIWLVVAIFADIFRSADLSGRAKAGWLILVLVLPFVGVFTYMIARGDKLSEHAMDRARRRDYMFGSYVRAGLAPSDVDPFSTPAALRGKAPSTTSSSRV